MNGKRLSKLDDSDNTNCYRRRQFLNIPTNLFEMYEGISTYTEEYVDDINFVQATVWLMSATMFMKDISVEQFYLVFNKQWRKDSGHHNHHPISGIEDRSTNFINDSQSVYASRTDLLCNVEYNINNRPAVHQQQYISKGRDIFNEKRNSPSVFTSFQKLQTFFCMQNATSNKYIIPDSDEEYASSSDIFRDSLASQEAKNIMYNEKIDKQLEKSLSDFVTEKPMKKFCSISPSSGLSKETFLKTTDYLAVTVNEDDSSDIVAFDDDYTLHRQNCNQLKRQLTFDLNKQVLTSLTQEFNLNFGNKDGMISSNQVNNSDILQKDSAYDTYRLRTEHTPTSASILQNKDIGMFSRQTIGNITPYQKYENVNDISDLDILTTDMARRDWIPDQDRQLYSCFSHRNSGRSIDSLEIECSHSVTPCTRNGHLQRDKSPIENQKYEGSNSKKRKLESAYKLADMARKTKTNEAKISSQWLRFTFEDLNVNGVAFQSVKVILSVLQNGKITRQYMRKRCWKDTLEEQAVNAILNFCDVFEAENKSLICTEEIVQAVTSFLDKCIENTGLNKVTMLTHRISIILQLCTHTKVCIETINHLTVKLKSYENVLISLMTSKRANVHRIIDQLHTIFYTLTLCLQKYRLVFGEKGNNQSEEEVIPPVVDLWKKQLKFEGAIVEDNAQTRERRWSMMLDDFTKIAMESSFVQFVEKSRTLVNILTSEKMTSF
ncbi:hypothetical protein WH47_12673 [Habropoda laboriosa]|uniref:Uncharacterized protein n=1 Tax=Habropoda laboriosa TaxID=597456 RepID=A0A0L7QKK4_9HYME|nr:hypothetical protein WH47_12673 [Habropoda laboriosa]